MKHPVDVAKKRLCAVYIYWGRQMQRGKLPFLHHSVNNDNTIEN